jgi:hypothetical protein
MTYDLRYGYGYASKANQAGFNNLIYNGQIASFVTFTRASTKNVLGASGSYVSYAVDQPAVEYNGDGTVKGLSLEDLSTNVILHSNDYSNGVWTTFGATIAADTEDGVFTGYKRGLASDTGGTLGNVRQAVTVVDDSTSWTASTIVQAGTSEIQAFAINFTGGATTLLSGVCFSTVTGDIVPVTNFAGAAGDAPDAYGIESLGNNKWRVWVTKANNSTGNTTKTTRLYPAPATTVTDSLGGSATGTCYVHHMQSENSRMMSTPIITTAAGVTRTADDAELENVANIGFNNKGTIYFELTLPDNFENNTASQILFRFENNGTSDNIRAEQDTSGNILFRTNISSTLELNISSTGLVGGVNKAAFSFEAGNYAMSINGATAVTSTEATFPTDIEKLTIARADFGFGLKSSAIKTVQFYPGTKTAGELESLTA